MIEKFLSATADYLKFTFGAMLLATAGFFLYAYIFAGGAEHQGNLDSVAHSVELSILSIVAVKVLSSFFLTGEHIANRLREGVGFGSLSYFDRLILSVASVFLSIDLLMILMENLISRHHEGIDYKKRR
jgi:hypothetical protein